MPGRICLACLAAIIGFFAIFGSILGIEALSGCDINGGIEPCLILGMDWNGLLTTFALIGGLGVFLLSPILIVVSLVMGAICAIRRRW
jgi:hypothetical protein